MDPPELASEPPRSRFGAALNSAPDLRPLAPLMLGINFYLRTFNLPQFADEVCG